jgi:hypothetical protein
MQKMVKETSEILFRGPPLLLIMISLMTVIRRLPSVQRISLQSNAPLLSSDS